MGIFILACGVLLAVLYFYLMKVEREDYQSFIREEAVAEAAVPAGTQMVEQDHIESNEGDIELGSRDNTEHSTVTIAYQIVPNYSAESVSSLETETEA